MLDGSSCSYNAVNW